MVSDSSGWSVVPAECGSSNHPTYHIGIQYELSELYMIVHSQWAHKFFFKTMILDKTVNSLSHFWRDGLLAELYFIHFIQAL